MRAYPVSRQTISPPWDFVRTAFSYREGVLGNTRYVRQEEFLVPIDLSGKNGVVFGVANERSIAWSITQALSDAGARLALTYQGDRLK